MKFEAKMKKLFFVLSIMVPLSCSAIPTPEKAKLAQELVDLTNVFDKMTGPMDHMIKQMPNPYATKFGEDKDKFEKLFREEISKSMKELMGGMQKSMLPQIRDFFAQQFTEDELQQLVAFYKLPVGKKYIEKSPEIMNKLMPEMQKSMQKKVMVAMSESIMSALQKAKSQGLKSDEIDKLIDQQKKQKEMMDKFLAKDSAAASGETKPASMK
jgi:uncharacterized protein